MAQNNLPVVNGLTPEQTQKWLAALAQRESSGKNQDNWAGYTGLFQFGSQALAGVGLVDRAKEAAARKSMSSAKWFKGGGQKAFLDDPDNWTIPGGKDAYWADPSLQAKSAIDLANQNLRSLPKVKLTSPEIIAGAATASHLVGAGAAKKFLITGADKTDANKTKASDYFNLGAKAISGKAVFDYEAPMTAKVTPASPVTTMSAPTTPIPVPTVTPASTPPKIDVSGQMANLDSLDPVDLLSGKGTDFTKPLSISIPATDTHDEITLLPENLQEQENFVKIKQLPKHLRDIAEHNLVAMSAANQMQPQSYRDIYPQEVIDYFSNMIDQSGVLDG